MLKNKMKTLAVRTGKVALVAAPLLVSTAAFAIDPSVQVDIDAAIVNTETVVTAIVLGLLGVVVAITGFGIVKGLLKS